MPEHPYKRLGDRAFWSRGVAGTFDAAEVADAPNFRLGGEDRFMSAGSCFAANVRRYLEAWGLTYVLTEQAHPAWPEAGETNYYEAFSARYGNIYTARQMHQLLLRSLDRWRPAEEYWEQDGLFADPLLPGLRNRARSLGELRALTAQHLSRVRLAVERATVLVFTLGLTEAWRSRLDGTVFPAAPGTVAGEFDPDRHEFVNFSLDEVSADLDGVVDTLREINRDIRVVLTVSPVPLVATASGRHVLVATSYSKSLLRLAAEQASRDNPAVSYFPAYEIALGPQWRELPFEDDLRNVREPVVAAIMNGFWATYFDRPLARHETVVQTAVRFDRLVAAAVDAECEEMMADAKLIAARRTDRPRAGRGGGQGATSG